MCYSTKTNNFSPTKQGQNYLQARYYIIFVNFKFRQASNKMVCLQLAPLAKFTTLTALLRSYQSLQQWHRWNDLARSL